MYHKELEKVIRHDTKGEFEHLLLALLSANREETAVPDIEMAEREAEELMLAETASWATAESTFTRVLSSRSYRQLLATFRHYEKLSNMDIEHSIQAHMHGHLKTLMLSLGWYEFDSES